MIENAVGCRDENRESLKQRIVSRMLADAHEKMLETLNINTHNLRNKINDLLLLRWSQ